MIHLLNMKVNNAQEQLVDCLCLMNEALDSGPDHADSDI